MTDDLYLTMAVQLFKKGTWSKEDFEKKVRLYAKELNINVSAIDEFINRVVNPKVYTIDEKRSILSVITFEGNELKYGDAVYSMSDDMVEKFYLIEENVLGKEKLDKYFEGVSQLRVVSNEIENSQEEIKNEERRQIVKVVKKSVSANRKQLESLKKNKKKSELTISDIINGNFEESDIVNNSECFEWLVNNVDRSIFDRVFIVLENKLGSINALNFKFAWERKHGSIDKKGNEEEIVDEEVIDVNEKVTENNIEENNVSSEEFIDESSSVSYTFDIDNNAETQNIGDIPETEEEFVSQAENITGAENDSNVETVEVSPERMEKLKKNKGVIKNYFLKTAIVIAALKILSPMNSLLVIGGYLYFANRIKNGRFNPENPIGKGVKATVEKIMNLGLPKKEIEREKTR